MSEYIRRILKCLDNYELERLIHERKNLLEVRKMGIDELEEELQVLEKEVNRRKIENGDS